MVWFSKGRALAMAIVLTIWKRDLSKFGHFCTDFKWFLTKWWKFVWISNGWASRFQSPIEIRTVGNPQALFVHSHIFIKLYCFTYFRTLQCHASRPCCRSPTTSCWTISTHSQSRMGSWSSAPLRGSGRNTLLPCCTSPWVPGNQRALKMT